MEAAPVETQAPAPQDQGKSPKKDNRKDHKKRDHQQSGKKGEKRPRMTNKQLYEKWEAEMTITLETEIPNLGAEKLKEPDNDALRTALKPITAEIDAKKAYIEKLKEERKKAIAEDKKARAAESGNFQELVGQSKRVRDEINAIEKERDIEQKEIDDRQAEKENLLKRVPGRKVVSVATLDEGINGFMHRLKNENMTGMEERNILAELKLLEEAKPLITRIKQIEEEIKSHQVTKKEIQKRFKASIDERKAIQERINEIKKQKETPAEGGEQGEKKEHDKKDRSKHPITIKIDGIQDEITALYDKKGALKKAHDDAYTAWREQQELETKIKWMKRQRNKLLDQKRKDDAIQAEKDEEERIQKEKEEIIRIYGKPKKYQPQIDICDNLIAFCNAMKPAHAPVAQNEAPKEIAPTQMSDVKGERLEVHIKQEEHQGVLPGQGGKKKRHKNKPKPEQKEENKQLTLTAETFTYFDNIKVSPPSVAADLVQALKDLQEKREYFIKLSDDLNEGVAREEPDLPKILPEGEEDDENAVAEKKPPKGKKVKVDDEEAFPML